MVAVFFMKSGLIKAVPLETGVTVNISWYVTTHACDKFSQSCLNEEKREAFEVSFFTTIMQSHIGLVLPMNFFLENHVEQYQNAAYSPDSGPCDFLFPKLKKQLRGIRFNDDNKMLKQTIDNFTKEAFKNCL